MGRKEVRAQIVREAIPPPPGAPYAVPLPGTEREGRTAVYRHWRYADKPLLETYEPHLQTAHDLFEDSLSYVPQRPCLGWRPWNPQTKTWEDKYEWLTYAEVAERRKNFGKGLMDTLESMGLAKPDEKFGVGLWSQNRPEWQITDLGLTSQSLYGVSLYETLGPDAVEYIVKHAELRAIVSSLLHIPTLLRLAAKAPLIKLIVSMDPLDAGEPAGHSKLALLNKIAEQVGVKICSMADIEALGARSSRQMRPPHRDDITTINYTSGTTGDPKGVVLTHRNAVAAISGSRGSDTFTEKDRTISYLPLGHIYGRLADQSALAEGAAVGFFKGDILSLVDDMKILQPSGFFSVPRLFNKFNAALRAATVQADGFKGALSRRVIEAKKASMKLPPGKAHNQHLLYDRIWTPKVVAALGLTRARAMVSGSAQLDPDVHEFMRAATGTHFVQGYGLTETYAVTSYQLRGDFTLGNIGPPTMTAEVCLESLPDLEYLITDKPNPRGELLIRGPVVFREYHRNPEETRKALDPDGWFHTGDVAEIDAMGRIKIVDRKKNVLKLSQGEYISPERIENVYLGNCSLLATAYVHGDPGQSALVAVFGVDPIAFSAFAGKLLGRDIAPTDLAAVRTACADDRVRKAVIKELDEVARGHKFNSYEKVKSCTLCVDPFTIDNGLFTPTLKLKRPQTARAFKADIDRMYKEINAAPAGAPKL